MMRVLVNRPASHRYCLLCGEGADHMLGLRFVQMTDGSVHCTWEGDPRFQGYTGILHGGVISAMLDSAMAHVLFARGVEGVTGELTVRFLHPAPCNAVYNLSASQLESHGRLFRLCAELNMADTTVARSTARFMAMKGKCHGTSIGSATSVAIQNRKIK